MLGKSLIAIWSLNLEKQFLRLIKFPVPNVESVFMDRRGKVVTLVTGRSVVYAYDVKSGRQIRCDSARKARRIGDVYWYYRSEQNRRIQNILTSRWHTLSIPEDVVWIEDAQCLNPKHLILLTSRWKLYVMDTKNGETHQMAEFPDPHLVFLNKNQHLLVRSDTWDCFEIYDLKTRSLLFTHYDEEICTWQVFGDNSLVSNKGIAVIYHANAKEWRYADLSQHEIWSSPKYVKGSLTSLNEHAQDIAVVRLSLDETPSSVRPFYRLAKEKLFLVLLNRQRLQFIPFKGDNKNNIVSDPLDKIYNEIDEADC